MWLFHRHPIARNKSHQKIKIPRFSNISNPRDHNPQANTQSPWLKSQDLKNTWNKTPKVWKNANHGMRLHSALIIIIYLINERVAEKFFYKKCKKFAKSSVNSNVKDFMTQDNERFFTSKLSESIDCVSVLSWPGAPWTTSTFYEILKFSNSYWK